MSNFGDGAAKATRRSRLQDRAQEAGILVEFAPILINAALSHIACRDADGATVTVRTFQRNEKQICDALEEGINTIAGWSIETSRVLGDPYLQDTRFGNFTDREDINDTLETIGLNYIEWPRFGLLLVATDDDGEIMEVWGSEPSVPHLDVWAERLYHHASLPAFDPAADPAWCAGEVGL